MKKKKYTVLSGAALRKGDSAKKASTCLRLASIALSRSDSVSSETSFLRCVACVRNAVGSPGTSSRQSVGSGLVKESIWQCLLTSAHR